MTNIQQQIENIRQALEWIKVNEPQDYDRQFLNFVEERRKLRKVMQAQSFNPAAAAYGESQKGKSYLMSNLLQKDGAPFMLNYGDKAYDFIYEINPIGNGAEATGVVTRFTSFQRNGELFSEEHPVAMRTLTVADIIMILSDGYYNDIRDYSVADNIKEKAEEFYNDYVNRSVVNGPVTADDLLEMQSYFHEYINNAQAYGKAGYFTRLALVADRIPLADYEKVYGFLWDNNEYFSKLFQRLLDLQSRLHFAPYLYLPMDALLHRGNNDNTIMAVQCLHGQSDEAQKHTEVYIREQGIFRTERNIRKCDLSAICAEVIVRIPDDFLDSCGEYVFDGIEDPQVMAQLSHEPVKKDILRHLDLLDFPGARSRKKEDKDTLGNGCILTTILLRGKVAYLFNKYNESSELNVLLFCHDQAKSEVAELPHLISSWVENYVGKTPEKRSAVIDDCGGVAPLFYISTKFNMDMALQSGDSNNATEALKGRWHQRFKKVLYNECFNADGKEWVKNWSSPGTRFSNSYLLRDFKYSGERGSRLYTDFEETGHETKSMIPDDYYRELRKTFIGSDDAGFFFPNPALAWDVAATINNDGALYIIEKLGIVAKNIEVARNKQFDEDTKKALDVVIQAMVKYQPATDNAQQMQRNIENAYNVLRELDFTCNNDNYYYGHLLEGLQLCERDIYDPIHQLILSGKLNEPLYNFEQYQIIRERCHNFEECETLEKKWERLMKVYHYASKQAASDDLTRRKIDTTILFADNLPPQLPSYLIAIHVLKLWKEKITSVDFQNTYAAEDGFAPGVLNEMVGCLLDAVDRLNLLDHLHKDLKDYTDIAAVKNIPVSLVADIIASSVSNFVADFGYSFLDEKKRNELEEMAKQDDLPVFKWISQPRQEVFSEPEVAELFSQVLSSGSALIPAFKQSFFAWEEYIFLAFLSRVERSKYALEITQQLATVIQGLSEK